MKGMVRRSTEKVKVLGVILDKKLTFQQQIDMVEKKTAKALRQLMIVGRIEKINTENMIKLCNSIEVHTNRICGSCVADSKLRTVKKSKGKD